MIEFNLRMTLEAPPTTEELNELIHMKLTRIAEHFYNLDCLLTGGAINDEIGMCEYKIYTINPIEDIIESSGIDNSKLGIQNDGECKVIEFDRHEQ